MTSFCITRLIASLLPLRCTDPLPYSAGPFPATAVSPPSSPSLTVRCHRVLPVPHRRSEPAIALTGAHHERAAIVVGARWHFFFPEYAFRRDTINDKFVIGETVLKDRK